ncbi:hypothetical protein JXQ70_06145 [bacterium]|nr:hypothetical protein [bacterium]
MPKTKMRLIFICIMLINCHWWGKVAESGGMDNVYLDCALGYYQTSRDHVSWPEYTLRYHSQKSHQEEVSSETLNSYYLAVGGTTALYARMDAHIRAECSYYPSIEIDYVNTYHRVAGSYEGEMWQYGYAIGLSFLLLPRERRINYDLSVDLASAYTFFEGDIEVERISWDKKLAYIVPGLGVSYTMGPSYTIHAGLHYRLNYDALEMSGPLVLLSLQRRILKRTIREAEDEQ